MNTVHKIEGSDQEPSQVVDPSKLLLQRGIDQKTGEELTIHFAQPFRSKPTVVISPFYTDPVGGIETLILVSTDRFTVRSENESTDYYVHWLAVGERP